MASRNSEAGASAASDLSNLVADPKDHAVQTRVLRISGVALLSVLGALILTVRINPARMDYIEYWASAHLLVHGGDPYSPAGVLALEKAHGYLPAAPLIMPNPPWALFLVAPLGAFGVQAGHFLWILIAGACILGSAHLLTPDSKDNALALLFAPAIACFGSGQSSPYLLLGCALFLYFQRSRPFAAGAALLLMAIKPHLFLAFWVVLLADCIYRRNFLVVAGCVSSLAAATAFTMLIDPHIWSHYLFMLRQHHPATGFIPTLSMIFRLLIDPNGPEFWPKPWCGRSV